MTSTTPIKVDRHLTTPFLLKVFYKVNSFHRLDDFRSTAQPSSFVEVYTWKDCSLAELTTLLLSALPSLASGATKCSFRLIYADTKAGRYTSQELGNVPLPLTGSSANGAGGGTGSEKLCLDEARFVVGDWIDVAVATGSASSAGTRGGPTPGPNGIRIRGRGGIGGSIPQGDWRKGERLDDEGPPTRGEGPPGVGGGRRFGGGGHGGGRRGGRW
ncbi:hypothetical protein TWF106_000959 [Orbilia oligospora]|uniref:Sin3-associated polypeptide Sap18 n=1 Tax=Orbilia oligospora TaxID=2813651 RepID=A0A6G1M4L5_ORBOL|nr:hypothetical protein TWF788_011101 [Orbilia oligospora]KAF3205972.1 hypothetical protein TWF106_000959 [Orbilia oligospora]KAF3216545.1 hypothetical protein TWF191_009031 [Orbilia oligospora]KAF3245051.1 hypothetical protein TWF192_007574 [Orbilia oligospora]